MVYAIWSVLAVIIVTGVLKGWVLKGAAHSVDLRSLAPQEPAHQVDVVNGRIQKDPAGGPAVPDGPLHHGFRVDAGAVLAAADGKPPTGELIAEVMLSDANCHTPPLRPYMEGGERSDMPYINFYLDYFAQGRPAFVPVEYMDYRDAVELVRDNGGVPVVAHPGLNFRGREETAGRLLDRGAAGLEVFNNYHTPEQAVYFTSLALSKGASMTCGSDFHGKTKPRIAVGRFPSDSRFDGRLSDFVNHIHVIGRQGV